MSPLGDGERGRAKKGGGGGGLLVSCVFVRMALAA